MPDKLTELLDSLALRPAMYAGGASFDTVRTFLSGLSVGLEWTGIRWTWDEYFAAAQARGWDPRGSTGIERDFREHGLSDEEMIMELVAVEKDAYARALQQLGKAQEPSRG